MPPTTNNGISPEVSQKKITKAKDPEVKKPVLRELESNIPENQAPPEAGENPAPPKPTKPRKPREKMTKAPGTTITDTLPKKNAQRAKGSISLNKSIEQTEQELKYESRVSISSTDKLPKGDGNLKKLKSVEEPKTPNSTQRRKKKKEGTEKGTDKPTEKGPDRVSEKGAEKGQVKSSASKPMTPTEEETSSCVSVELKTLEVVNQEVEARCDDIPPTFNSCSFFEKIQQGVKAYFSSRSSFNPEDRNKKEGGIQTRGRVGNGVSKEDSKKRKPGLKLKNKINSPERNLPYGLRRLNSSKLGGQSSNFLPGRPKILRNFRMLKRKKLYHPKKYYVRIQIPRKEYFYRSTVGIQNRVLPAVQRMERQKKTKVEAKIRTPGLAPKRIETHGVRELERGFPGSTMETLQSEFEGGESADNFEQRVSEFFTSNWPVSFEEVVMGFEHPHGEGWTCAISENGRYGEKTENMGDDFPEFEEIDKTNWGGLIECLNSAIGREQFIYNLEIGEANEISPNAYFLNGVQNIAEDSCHSRNLDTETVCASEEASTTLCHPERNFSTASLMGGIDLHLELQNYLKAIEGFHNNKGRTKNTLQCNYYDNYIPIKIYSSSQDLQNGAEEFYDVAENKSTSSFDSASSHSSQLEKAPNEMFFDLTQEPDATTEPKPETKDREKNSVLVTAALILNGKTWPSEKPPDSYDKIQPYRTDSTPRCRRKNYLYKNPVCFLSVPRDVRGAASDTKATPNEHSPPPEEEKSARWSPTLQELIDIYNSVLRQNKKLRRSTDTGKRRSSSQLFAYMIDKLKEKRFKADLINMSKDFRAENKPNTFYKGRRPKSNVEDYVAMFQEILSSSLSLEQIARLNNLISGLYSVSEKNYARMKEINEEEKKISNDGVQKRSDSEEEEKPIPKAPPVKKTVTFENPPAAEMNSKKSPRAKSKATKQSKEDLKKVEVPYSIDLESMLKFHFCSVGEEHASGKEKVLVTVTLSGNQVLVNDLTYFNNEDALSSDKTPQNGTSELIIENVTNGKDIWYKNTKSSDLRIQKCPSKQGKINAMVGKPAARKKNGTKARKTKETKKGKECAFEYDEMQFKVQHPMEAIAETSELKLIEANDRQKSKPPPETGILLQDIPSDASAMKKMLKEALEGRTFSKHSLFDFGRSEENIGSTSLAVTLKTPAKRRPTPKKKKKAATVRSMVDLKKGPKTRKAAPLPPYRRYLCYSSVSQFQSRKKSGFPGWSIDSAASTKIKPKAGDHQKEGSKKTSKEEGQKRKKTDPPTPCKSQTGTTDKSLDVDAGQIIDSVEFLFPDYLEDFPKVDSLEAASITSQDAKSVEIPIAFISEATNNDGTSFLAEMIHSDSFLANMSQSKLKSLVKCSSDIKFYPGRLTESGNEPAPLVKFVLTPTQIEKANLPPNQVEIVSKDHKPHTSGKENDQEAEKEKSLRSIEEFINHLSKCRKLAERKKKQAKAKDAQTAEAKSPSGGKGVASNPPIRKPLRECQKRKSAGTIAEKGDKAKESKGRAKDAKNPSQKEKSGAPDIFLSKMVLNLSKALKNFKNNEKQRNSKPEPRKRILSSAGDLDKQKNEEKTKDREANAAGAPPELRTDVKKAIALAVARAIARAYASRTGETVEDFQNGSPDKTVKIKICCREPKSDSPGESSATRQDAKPAGEIDLVDSLVAREAESGDLNSKNSTYFDALEEKSAGGDDRMGDPQAPKAAEGVLNADTKLGEKEKREAEKLTPSDEELFLNNKSEMIFERISKTLEEGEISYSMALLDAFLDKFGNSDCARLKKLLTLVEEKSTNIIKSMEKVAWLKVLSLLEEALHVFENDNDEASRKMQQKTAKDFIEKIHALNIRRLIDLQNFFSSFSGTPKDDGGSVFVRLKDSIVYLKRFALSPTAENSEVADAGSAIKIHSTVSLPDIKEENLKETKGLEDDRQGRELSRKLRQQYACLEQLTNCEDECYLVPEEIRDVKRKVSEKLKVLEKTVRSPDPQQTATSHLSVPKSYGNGEAGTSSGGTADAGGNRTQGYVELLRGLLKAWDTRLTLNSITGDKLR